MRPVFFKRFSVLLLCFQLAHCSNAKQLALQGLEAYDEGKKITALRYFEEALKKDAGNPYALYGKGRLMLDSTITIDIGKRMLRDSIDGLPPQYQTKAYLALAQSYAMTNQYEEALKILDEAEDNNLMSAELAIENIRYNILLRNFTLSRNRIVKYIERFPDSVPLMILAAVNEVKYAKGYTRAIDYLKSASKVEPGNPEVVKKTAIVYYEWRKYDQAIEWLEKLKTLQAGAEEKAKIDTWIEEVRTREWNIKI